MRTKPVSLEGLTALEVAQQIIDEFGPPGTVTAWRAVENQANVVELDLADGSAIKFVGLFAHHILSADHKQRKATSIDCICGIDADPTGKLPRLDVVCPKHDGIFTSSQLVN